MWPMVHLCSFSEVSGVRNLQELILQQCPNFCRLSAACGTFVIPQQDAGTQGNIEILLP